jgi:hypothetical protein
MSEFKFACPVCGQHITADSSTSGTRLECPTCFQRMVVPQAPLGGDPKLILTAAKVSDTRSKAFEPGPERAADGAGSRRLRVSATSLLLLVGTGGVAFLLWRNQLDSLANGIAERAAKPAIQPQTVNVFQSPHPVPTQVKWSLDVTNAPIPSSDVVGRIHGNGFLCERATLKGGRLSLRQGSLASPDLGITVTLGVRQPEELSNKLIVVTTNKPGPGPRVVLRWKDEQQEPVTQRIHAGYAMKVIFGQAVGDRIHGRIYIAVPDELKSFAAGNFDAEIVKPAQPLAGK